MSRPGGGRPPPRGPGVGDGDAGPDTLPVTRIPRRKSGGFYGLSAANIDKKPLCAAPAPPSPCLPRRAAARPAGFWSEPQASNLLSRYRSFDRFKGKVVLVTNVASR